jgi:uncharacterized protein (DUF58 family)
VTRSARRGPDRLRAGRSRGFVRPVRPLVPIASSVLVVLGWGVVAHNSGAGWVQALGDVVAGTLLLGILGPGFVLSRARLRVTKVPTDGTAGQPCQISVVSSSRVRLSPVRPPGPDCFVGPAGVPAPPDGDAVTLIPDRRGLVSHIAVEVASSAPFGLLWWSRRLRLALPSDVHIGPRLGPPVELPRQEDDRSGDSPHRSPRDIGEPRGVRPYRPGDSRRWVHWPATAHSGELMVREMEGPTAEPVVVVVTLPSDADAAESVAEKAFGTLVALFDRGTSVFLTTVEVSGRRTDAVSDRRSAGRRLARAVAPGGPTGPVSLAEGVRGPESGTDPPTGTPGVLVTMGDLQRPPSGTVRR